MTCKFKVGETYKTEYGLDATVQNIDESLGLMKVSSFVCNARWIFMTNLEGKCILWNIIPSIEKEFKIEVGGFYLTRSGKKAFVFKIEEDKRYPVHAVILGDVELYTFTTDGLLVDNQKNQSDLLEEWTEEVFKTQCAEKHA